MMLTFAISTYAQTTGEKIKEFADKHMRLSGYLQGGYRYDGGYVLIYKTAHLKEPFLCGILL